MEDPHTSRDTKEHIRHLRWERLDHPAYSPELAPSDFHLFPEIKSAQSGRHFRSNEEVQRGVKNFFLRLLGTEFCQGGFLKLISLYDKCTNVCGEYAEK
ncbi:hypothetical protein AVEN_60131-1 [Araneus ventricosus]|uniref:Histone-lysine N-methyltransferase SETMAR n=1 Tax=Araneus ventricosus TaxID=182803 RepID=A0A4Y2GH62_ARAVE|nr:hypothetical protein AVEN_60131-1 [Araneus ventricosus]